ncbi:MAG: hypothetical protein ACRC1K_02215, partial [Planctomycetia bacterium]
MIEDFPPPGPLEERLRAAAPDVSIERSRELLYQCGVAAGRAESQRSLERSVRRWRTASLALAGMLAVGGVGVLWSPAAVDRAVSVAFGPVDVVGPSARDSAFPDLPAARRDGA